MGLSLTAGERFCCAVVAGFLMLPCGFARERGPRVEVVSPSLPVPVKVAEQQVLVYELHVTNFETVPLTLNRLEVFADTEKSQPLSVISGDALPAIMMQVGSGMGEKGSQTIGPGKRVVIFLWIKGASDKRPPAVLRAWVRLRD
jgi:hypothetical protein